MTIEISDGLFAEIMKYIKDRKIRGSWWNDRRYYELVRKIESEIAPEKENEQITREIPALDSRCGHYISLFGVHRPDCRCANKSTDFWFNNENQ